MPFTLWSVCVVPPGVVQGEISTKVQGRLCESFKRILPWTFLESERVLPEAFCEVLSRFQKVNETRKTTLVQFYIWTRFGVIGEPLIRLEKV